MSRSLKEKEHMDWIESYPNKETILYDLMDVSKPEFDVDPATKTKEQSCFILCNQRAALSNRINPKAMPTLYKDHFDYVHEQARVGNVFVLGGKKGYTAMLQNFAEKAEACIYYSQAQPNDFDNGIVPDMAQHNEVAQWFLKPVNYREQMAFIKANPSLFKDYAAQVLKPRFPSEWLAPQGVQIEAEGVGSQGDEPDPSKDCDDVIHSFSQDGVDFYQDKVNIYNDEENEDSSIKKFVDKENDDSDDIEEDDDDTRDVNGNNRADRECTDPQFLAKCKNDYDRLLDARRIAIAED
eukprot:167723_1